MRGICTAQRAQDPSAGLGPLPLLPVDEPQGRRTAGAEELWGKRGWGGRALFDAWKPMEVTHGTGLELLWKCIRACRGSRTALGQGKRAGSLPAPRTPNSWRSGWGRTHEGEAGEDEDVEAHEGVLEPKVVLHKLGDRDGIGLVLRWVEADMWGRSVRPSLAC